MLLRLVRPVSGRIVATFGSLSGGASNDGVDIAAEAAAPVRVAAGGRVAFVSDAKSTLGSVVLVRHDGGLVTIYGGIDDIAVRQGQRVKQGDMIARVATPPRGGRSMLHFELRRGSEPIDPTPYI